MATQRVTQESITYQSVKSLKALSQIGGSQREVNAGRRSQSKHGLQSFQNLHQPFKGVRVETPLNLDLPSATQHDLYGTNRPTLPTLVLPGQLHRDEPITHRWPEFAPSPSFPILKAPPFEVALQSGERQAVISAEFGCARSARFEFNHQPLDLLTASSLPQRPVLDSCHPHSPPKNAADEQVGMVRRLRMSSQSIENLR